MVQNWLPATLKQCVGWGGGRGEPVTYFSWHFLFALANHKETYPDPGMQQNEEAQLPATVVPSKVRQNTSGWGST